MNKELKEKAVEYLRAELSVIPTKEDKKSAISWKPYQSEKIPEENIEALFNDKNVIGLGVITGAISGSLEVIDVDTKYCITGSLWNDLKSLIEDNLPEVYKKLVIAQTKSGGYHIYYRCSVIAGNLKLASRYTTKEEKDNTYKKEIQQGATPESANQRATNDKVRVLIETRGEGGYVIAPPSLGYNFIQLDVNHIPTITPEEREILFNIAESFNELEEEVKPKISNLTANNYSSTGLAPFEDYNNRGDIISLLESKGWKVVNQTGQRINLLRPGATDSKTSGNYHIEKKVLRVFSSSTEFNPDKRGYSHFQVFSLLECNGDNKLANRRLLEEGYGEPYKGKEIKPTQLKTASIKVEVVNSVNKEISVISNPGDNLKIENIESAIGNEIIINSPGLEAKEEILKAIALIQQTAKRIYIKEGGNEYREFTYQLNDVFKRYRAIQEEVGGFTDRHIDSLLDEVVIIASKLQPIDKDKALKEFLELGGVADLGISEESISITVDRLTTNRDKELQAKELKNLLSEVTDLQDKGSVDKAIELMDKKLKEVKLQDKATDFNKLLLPTSEAQIKEELKNTPNDLDTGYTIKGDKALIPGGGITVFAGATNHGKTAITINTTLNVAIANPDKKFIFFTYEENSTAILQYFLNTYINIELNKSEYNTSNRRLIREYFKTGSTEFMSSNLIQEFINKKEEFFKTYIETGRILIKYVEYTSEELTLAIRYLHKKEPNLGGVFIDYFQLLSLPGKTKKEERINSRQEELKEICIQLKKIAIETGLPLCLGAQFNREAINLLRLHPTNISEAGDIERIVNTLYAIWDLSKSVDSANTSAKDKTEIQKRTGGKTVGMYIELLKSRDLATGIYEVLDYNGKTGKIKNKPEEEITNF